MYKYGNMKDAKPGDIVEYMLPGNTRSEAGFLNGELYVVGSYSGGNSHIYVEGSATDSQPSNFKLILTKPGSEAKKGDTVIFIEDFGGDLGIGTVHTLKGNGYFENTESVYSSSEAYKVLQPELTTCTSTDSTNTIYSNTTSVPSYVIHDDLADAISNLSEPLTQPKESIMNPETPITIAMTAKEYAKHTESKTTEGKSDFQLRKPFSVVMYDEHGNHDGVQTFKKEKQALAAETAYLQDAKSGARTVIMEARATKKRQPITVVEVF